MCTLTVSASDRELALERSLSLRIWGNPHDSARHTLRGQNAFVDGLLDQLRPMTNLHIDIDLVVDCVRNGVNSTLLCLAAGMGMDISVLKDLVVDHNANQEMVERACMLGTVDVDAFNALTYDWQFQSFCDNVDLAVERAEANAW